MCVYPVYVYVLLYRYDELPPMPGQRPFVEGELREGEMPLATLVSTVLLKAYLLADDVLVLPFLQQRNDCDLEECQNILRVTLITLTTLTTLTTPCVQSITTHSIYLYIYLL